MRQAKQQERNKTVRLLYRFPERLNFRKLYENRDKQKELAEKDDIEAIKQLAFYYEALLSYSLYFRSYSQTLFKHDPKYDIRPRHCLDQLRYWLQKWGETTTDSSLRKAVKERQKQLTTSQGIIPVSDINCGYLKDNLETILFNEISKKKEVSKKRKDNTISSDHLALEKRAVSSFERLCDDIYRLLRGYSKGNKTRLTSRNEVVNNFLRPLQDDLKSLSVGLLLRDCAKNCDALKEDVDTKIGKLRNELESKRNETFLDHWGEITNPTNFLLKIEYVRKVVNKIKYKWKRHCKKSDLWKRYDESITLIDIHLSRSAKSLSLPSVTSASLFQSRSSSPSTASTLPLSSDSGSTPSRSEASSPGVESLSA